MLSETAFHSTWCNHSKVLLVLAVAKVYCNRCVAGGQTEHTRPVKRFQVLMNSVSWRDRVGHTGHAKLGRPASAWCALQGQEHHTGSTARIGGLGGRARLPSAWALLGQCSGRRLFPHLPSWTHRRHLRLHWILHNFSERRSSQLPQCESASLW